jgi:hypothetical protein
MQSVSSPRMFAQFPDLAESGVSSNDAGGGYGAASGQPAASAHRVPDCKPGAQPFDAVVAGGTLRRLASGPFERALVARLEMTAVQRGANSVCMCETPEGASSRWFDNAYHGVTLGIVEGIVLDAEPQTASVLAFAAASHGHAQLALVTAVSTDALPDHGKPVTRKLELGPNWHGARTRARFREVMRFADDYEQTLNALGRHTRRNMRNARKLAEAEGITFAFASGAFGVADELRIALGRNTQPYPVSERRIRGFEAYADASGQPFRSTLSVDPGQIISYCCGFIDGASAYLVYQLNDREWSRVGPSLMHRAYLLEALIQRGRRELIYVHGCSGILRHACVPMVLDRYFFMRRSPAARLGAKFIAALWPQNALGKAVRSALEMI